MGSPDFLGRFLGTIEDGFLKIRRASTTPPEMVDPAHRAYRVAVSINQPCEFEHPRTSELSQRHTCQAPRY
jgi:hypothetical protein